MSNENRSICSPCGGKCCKSYAGIVSPEDIQGDPVNACAAMIDSGKYCLDLWDRDSDLEETYFLRPRHKNRHGSVIDASWGGECIFLTDKGCQLSYKERPK